MALKSSENYNVLHYIANFCYINQMLCWIQVPPRAPKEKSSQSGWLFSFGAAIFAFGELNRLSPAKLPAGSWNGEYNIADAFSINIAFTKWKYRSGQAGISINNPLDFQRFWKPRGIFVLLTVVIAKPVRTPVVAISPFVTISAYFHRTRWSFTVLMF